jgi:glycolate oxidase subunit GlcD
VSEGLQSDLRRLLGARAVAANTDDYIRDSTEMQGLRGRADAAVLPETVAQVQKVVHWCCEHSIPMIPRGGGTGFAGGAVPNGGVVICLERINRLRSIEPELWRMHVDAGLVTTRIHQIARENGLYYPPDPGAAEQSQIGGNIACNAGGPHSFKYGVTRDWVTGIEAVITGGDLIHCGGPIRKDVASYDMRSLFSGSEGTLGIITGAWLRLIPAPAAQVLVIATYPNKVSGVSAIMRVYGSGLRSGTLEYLDAGALDAARAAFPDQLPDPANFMVLAEADGSRAEADALAGELEAVLRPQGNYLRVIRPMAEQREIWRWRSGVSFAVSSKQGGKMSEDIVVPVDRLLEALELLEQAGMTFGLNTCSWGHAGDGNLHATFLIDPASTDQISRATQAAAELFKGTIGLGGSISGEHGLGMMKRHHLALQLTEPELKLQVLIKGVFDPNNVFNPHKKLPEPDDVTPSVTPTPTC